MVSFRSSSVSSKSLHSDRSRFGKTRNGVERDASRNAATIRSRSSFSVCVSESESAAGSDFDPDLKKSREHAHDPTDAACFGGAYDDETDSEGVSTPNATRAPINDALKTIRSSVKGASDPSARNASSAMSSSASEKKSKPPSSRVSTVSSTVSSFLSCVYAHAAASTSLLNRASVTHASLAPCGPRFDSGASHFARRTSARDAAPRRLARCTFCLCQCALSSLGKTSRLAAASRVSTSRASCNAAAALPGPFGGGTSLCDGWRVSGRGPEGDSESLATSDGSVAPAAAARRARNPTERPARAPRRGAEGHRVARGGGTARAEDAAVADADAISTPRTDRARERV